MNREPDFDQTLRYWFEDGADRAPERFVWAALENVERTAQRGGWQASPEGFPMRLKTVAPYAGVAAAIVLAIAAFQLFVGPNIGGPSPSPVPTRITANLEDIVVTDANAPEGLTVYRTHTGIAAVDVADIALGDSPGFVDAILSEFDGDDVHEGSHEDRYWTFAAEFKSVADAQRAFDAAVANLKSTDGWGLSPSIRVTEISRRYRPELDLGDESAGYIKGNEYGYPLLSVYLWRVENMLLEVVDFHPYDRPELLQSIAKAMDARAL